MANPTTTHVIEIETGIGEPAFIPLSLGKELQPISVGKKGMWRIESPRVLDVHAFVYFDGASLFVQSADESNAAAVDGFRVGKAWTELHAPCKIEIGQARLRFRSLIADDNPATERAMSPPVQAPPDGPGAPPGHSMPVADAPPPPREHHRVDPPPASSSPIVFPRAERPFKPGEFASSPDEGESTRIAPLETTGGGRIASSAHARPMQVQGAMAGMPEPGGGFDATPPPQMQQPPSPRPSGGQGSPSGPVAYGASAMGPNGPGMAPQGSTESGSIPHVQQQAPLQPQRAGPPPAGGQPMLAKLKENPLSKIVAGLLFMIVGIIIGGTIYLRAHGDPPKTMPVLSLDRDAATPVEVDSGSATAPQLPSWPIGVPCPPPNWPPNTPLPCVPKALSPSADPTPPAPPSGKPPKGDKDGGKPPKGDKDGGAATPAKTLERQAVDFVASGDTARAAAAYEELVKREPNNKVYAEAARILRAKLDAGAPP